VVSNLLAFDVFFMRPDWQVDHWIKLTEKTTVGPVTATTPPHSRNVLTPERTLSVLEVEVKKPPAGCVATL
ncbi:hypothetical protein VUT07_33275, partial [Pseudomonas aeruginosa]|uniref:hypothetical protein n=1 Tax=Pseudomonas aeruginosa TaxID=287 RepID=UPI0030069423